MLSYLSGVWQLRYFWLALVHCDLRSRYRGSVLGMGWSMLQPLGMTIILCGVFSGLFHLELSFFAPFLLSGLALWQFFSACALTGCQCFFLNAAYIRQFPAPMAIYPLRVILGAGFHASLSLLIALAATCYFLRVPSLLPLLSLIPSLLLILLFGWAIAVLFGLMNLAFRDTQHLAEVGLQGLYFLTPILYPLEQFASRVRFVTLLRMNPLTSLLDLIRQPLLYDAVPSVGTIQASLIMVFATCGIAALLLARQERRIIFQL